MLEKHSCHAQCSPSCQEPILLTAIVAAAAAAADLPLGDCMVDDDCAPSSSLMVCNTTNTTLVQRCSCLNSQRTCSMVGQCQPTPCGVCQSGLVAARAFAAGTLPADPVQLKLQWLSFCGRQWPASGDQCNLVASQLALTPATARRAGLLVSIMGLCNAASAEDCIARGFNVITNVPDRCTADGTTSGPQLPNTMAPAQASQVTGTCRANSDCPALGAFCNITASSQQRCICQNGEDDCFTPGTCAALPCTVCSACLTFASGFAASRVNESSASTLSEAFLSSCGNASIDAAACSTTATAIGSSLALGKRAGGVCRSLGLCPTNLTADCTLLVRPPSGTLMTAPAPQLDLCTVEGVPSGSQLPGVVLPGTLPTGGCPIAAAASCGSPDLRCDESNPQQVRSCTGGVDSNTPAGKCVNTTCAICKGCLQAMLDTFVLPTQFVNGSGLETAFSTACQALPGATATQVSKCQQVASSFTAANGAAPEAATMAATLSRRAGALCAALGADGGCSADVDATCRASLVLPSGRLNGTLDRCTVEGVAGGSLPAGLSPANGESLTETAAHCRLLIDSRATHHIS
jgi:hypothetical protein